MARNKIGDCIPFKGEKQRSKNAEDSRNRVVRIFVFKKRQALIKKPVVGSLQQGSRKNKLTELGAQAPGWHGAKT